MTKEDYIKNYTKEVPQATTLKELCGDNEKYNEILSKDTDCYLTTKQYLGTSRLVEFLAEHEITHVDSTIGKVDGMYTPVANIGFSEKENKWYGWSHRAIFGFTIGSECKKGDCSYRATCKEEYKQECLDFWEDECRINLKVGKENEDGFILEWTRPESVIAEDNPERNGSVYLTYPDEFGRGEWTAKTIEDAKQMAIDFANNVM